MLSSDETRPLQAYFEILRSVYEFTLSGTVADLKPFLESTFNKTNAHFRLGHFAFFIFSEPIKIFASTEHANQCLGVLQEFRDANGLLPQTIKHAVESRYYPINCPTEITLGAILVSGVSSQNAEPLDVLIDAIVHAINTAHNRHVSSRISELWDTFAVEGSSPEGGFQKVVDNLYSAVSFFDPIDVKDSDLAINQLLLVQDDPGWLRIRASRPYRFINLLIQANKSISGLTLEDERTFLCINPNNEPYRERYLNYISPESSEPDSPGDVIDVKSELVVPIKHQRRVIAVLNLESKRENAFSSLQIGHLVEYSQRIAILLKMLETQWVILYEGPKLTHDATASYLEAYTKSLDHDVMTPVRTLDEAIGKLADIVGSEGPQIDSEKIIKQIDVIENERRRLEAQAEEVIERLGLLNEQQIDVKDLVEDTILVLKRVHRLGDGLEFISISNDVPLNRTIHAHGLVRVYLFHLFDNAARLLREKRDLIPDFKGEIVVKLEKSRRYNGAYFDTYEVIDIRDNGPGVTEEQLAELRKFNAGTRFRSGSGKGAALVAAYRYMKQQGGGLDIDSKKDEFFQVRLAFRSLEI